MRAQDAGAPRCFLCAGCAKRRAVVERLQRYNFTLDVTGLSGKPLFRRSECVLPWLQSMSMSMHPREVWALHECVEVTCGRSKFCAEVSKLSKEAMDKASGARADVLRHTGRGW